MMSQDPEPSACPKACINLLMMKREARILLCLRALGGAVTFSTRQLAKNSCFSASGEAKNSCFSGSGEAKNSCFSGSGKVCLSWIICNVIRGGDHQTTFH